MKGFMDMMSKARELQSRMSKMQDELAELTVTGESGAGLVRVTLDGRGRMKNLQIDESLARPDEREIMEDLVVAAHNDARDKLEKVTAEKMQSMTGDLPLPPGMKLF